MDHVKVLKRAWEILWRYRVLWVFGVIVVLCAAGTSGNLTMNLGGGDGYEGPNAPPWAGEWRWEGEPFAEVMPQILGAWATVAGAILAIVTALCCVAIILSIAKVIFLYIGETALIRMVDDYEETGEKRGVRQGFRLGWSRTALRLFVIDLLTRLPGMLILLILLMLGAGLAALFFLFTDSTVVMVIGAVAVVGLGFLTILAAIVLSLAISLVRPLIFRVCALERRGVIESFRVGFDFIKAHLADTVVMWLIMVGLQIGWGIAMIPVVLFLLMVGGVLAGLAGLSVGGLSSLIFEGFVPWIVGFGVGVPLFVLIMSVPLLLLGGLAEVFKSSVWTLTYRELRALEGLAENSGELADPSESAG
ncbi:MAG TPA: hypothetical protein VMW58_00130 [Anaerolineae bacterium]|nr:hypothetical protein [Anaerolineae bacterium]